MAKEPRVFISYARSDGLAFARHLRDWLKLKGVPVWQDLVGMEGGWDWLEQIKKAIGKVEFLVLVMTPNALKSDSIRKEWRYARQEGVCVYPVKAVPDGELDFPSVPRWMSSAQWYGTSLNCEGEPDFAEQWGKLLNDLNTRCQRHRVPFMVEDLPGNFVERPAEFDALINLLRDPKREEPVAMDAVAVTPDGGQAISASADHTLKVWNLKSGKALQTLEGHSGWVNALVVTPDGEQAISGSDDETLKVWDLKTGKAVRTLKGHSGVVNAVAVTPDGRRAISASDDKTLKVWDLESGGVIASFSADGALYGCAVAPDGKTFVAGDALGRVHFLKLEAAETGRDKQA